VPGERRLVPPLTTTKTYTAGYERDVTDDAWNVRIKGIPGCQSYGRSIRQAQQRIREALALIGHENSGGGSVPVVYD